ncbi:MAG: hypothetical protein JSS81_12685 [Acidobacteria bacterium]|nr:hypothetical protein [Acidobacteriota bacterium]
MLKKSLVISLILVALNLTGGLVRAQTPTDADPALTAKIKAKVAKYGAGKKVVVKLRDGARMSGYISTFDDDSFVFRDKKTNATTDVGYAQVKKIDGGGLPAGAQIAIIAAAAVPVIILLRVLAVISDN